MYQRYTSWQDTKVVRTASLAYIFAYTPPAIARLFAALNLPHPPLSLHLSFYPEPTLIPLLVYTFCGREYVQQGASHRTRETSHGQEPRRHQSTQLYMCISVYYIHMHRQFFVQLIFLLILTWAEFIIQMEIEINCLMLINERFLQSVATINTMNLDSPRLPGSLCLILLSR